MTTGTNRTHTQVAALCFSLHVQSSLTTDSIAPMLQNKYGVLHAIMLIAAQMMRKGS